MKAQHCFLKDIMILGSQEKVCKFGKMVENGNGNGENVAQPQAQAQPLDVGVGGLQSFDPRSDPHNVSQRWKTWLRAFRL